MVFSGPPPVPVAMRTWRTRAGLKSAKVKEVSVRAAESPHRLCSGIALSLLRSLEDLHFSLKQEF